MLTKKRQKMLTEKYLNDFNEKHVRAAKYLPQYWRVAFRIANTIFYIDENGCV